MNQTARPRVAIHKFSSCDGCQLAFLNMGEGLLHLNEQVELVHFLEAGIANTDAAVDIAFVEGSLSTSEDAARIQRIRQQSRYLISIGACATSGGIQALRNFADAPAWTADIYASPQYIDSLDKVQAIAAAVPVDLELWGCPVNTRQVITAIRSLLLGVAPRVENDKLCLACKRRQTVCVLVSKGEACLGAITRSDCGALCPAFGRDCYGCYGPAENPQTDALAECLAGLGLPSAVLARRFRYIHSQDEAMAKTADKWRKK